MDKRPKTAKLMRFGPEFFSDTDNPEQEAVLLYGQDGNFVKAFESVQHAKVWCAAAGVRLEDEDPGELTIELIRNSITALEWEGLGLR